MSSSLGEEEEPMTPAAVTTSLTPCAGCRHQRRRCLSSCVLAPYFPAQDGARFNAVHRVFGASNVSKLLAELRPEDRAEAAESLVYQANERIWEPTMGCVSYISILQNVIQHVEGEVAAAREALAGLVGREAAFRPFDASAATFEARQEAEVRLARALRFAEEKYGEIRTMILQRQAAEAAEEKDQMAAAAAQTARRDQTQMMPQAAAAPKRRKHAVAQHSGVGRGFSDGQPRQPMMQRMEAQESGSSAVAAQAMSMQQAVAEQQYRHHGTGLAFPDGRAQGHHLSQTVQQSQKPTALDQDAMMLQQIATLKQKSMLQQLVEAQQMTAAADVAGQQNMTMSQAAAAAAAQEYPLLAEQYLALGFEQQRQNQQMAEIARAQDSMVMRAMQQEEQYCAPLVPCAAMEYGAPSFGLGRDLQHPVLPPMMAADEITMEQDMLIRETAAAAGLTLDQYLTTIMMMMEDEAVGQLHASGNFEQYATMGLTGDLNTKMMQQNSEYLDLHQLMAQEMANTQQEQQYSDLMMMQQAAAYAHAVPGSAYGEATMPFLPGGSARANADAFLLQQPLQTANVQVQLQEEPSLPPSLADLALQEPFLPAGYGSADAAAFDVQQQAKTVSAFGSQLQPPLPPSVTNLALYQQQNYGGNDGESSNFAAYFAIPDPNLPPDGRSSGW